MCIRKYICTYVRTCMHSCVRGACEGACMCVLLHERALVGARTSVSEGAHVCMRMGVHLRGRDVGAPA